MTYIEISGSDEDLKELKLLSEEVFRENGIQAKPEIYHFNQDSFDAEQLLPTLLVVFSGVSAVAQIVNLVINIQEKRIKTSATRSNTPFHIKMKASNNRELDLKILGVTEEEIKYYQKLVQKFVSDFL